MTTKDDESSGRFDKLYSTLQGLSAHPQDPNAGRITHEELLKRDAYERMPPHLQYKARHAGLAPWTLDMGAISSGMRAAAALINNVAWEQANRSNEPPAAPSHGRVYLSGPMSDIPLYNHPAFNTEAARLRDLGWHVENPAEAPLSPNSRWIEFMHYAIPSLLSCQHIRMLDGWTMSRGARLEHHIAIAMGIDVLHDAECAGSAPTVAEMMSAPDGSPTMTIGAIGARLGFPVTAAFLGQLGFAPAARDKAAVLFHEADFRHIRAALLRHVGATR